MFKYFQYKTFIMVYFIVHSIPYKYHLHVCVPTTTVSSGYERGGASTRAIIISWPFTKHSLNFI